MVSVVDITQSFRMVSVVGLFMVSVAAGNAFLWFPSLVSFYGFRRGRKRFLMASVAERFLMVSVAASNDCFTAASDLFLSRQVTFLSRQKTFYFLFIAASNDCLSRQVTIVYRGR